MPDGNATTEYRRCPSSELSSATAFSLCRRDTRERRTNHYSRVNRAMRALVKASATPGFSLAEVPEPTIREDEVLIRVRRAGVCGTDVHIYEWDDWASGRCHPSFIVGHEFAARHHFLGRKPECRTGRNLAAQQVAGGDVRHLQVGLETGGLGALA